MISSNNPAYRKAAIVARAGDKPASQGGNYSSPAAPSHTAVSITSFSCP
jgi:hypothetical protein